MAHHYGSKLLDHKSEKEEALLQTGRDEKTEEILREVKQVKELAKDCKENATQIKEMISSDKQVFR